MPSATGVVQEAGVPGRPSISTRQMRQEPNAFMLSVAQSFGMSVPARLAARMIEVPAGTVTLAPSMVSVTLLGGRRGGRAAVDVADQGHDTVSTSRAPSEILGKVPQRATVPDKG